MDQDKLQPPSNNVLKVGAVEIYWLKHDGFKIKANEGVIYIDPYKLNGDQEKADILFISHSHFDHLDETSIKAVVKPETTIFCSDDCKAQLSDMVDVDSVISLFPNDDYIFGHLKISATFAYNLEKPFHPKEKQWLGFLLKIAETKIYFAGDTDHLKELESIECDVGLFPVSGIYVMDPQEAAGLANIIKPKVMSVPMHWGAVIDDQNRLVGSIDDAKKFCELCQGPSQILTPIA